MDKATMGQQARADAF